MDLQLYMFLYHMSFHVYRHYGKPEHGTPAGLEWLVGNGGLYMCLTGTEA